MFFYQFSKKTFEYALILYKLSSVQEKNTFFTFENRTCAGPRERKRDQKKFLQIFFFTKKRHFAATLKEKKLEELWEQEHGRGI